MITDGRHREREKEGIVKLKSMLMPMLIFKLAG